MALLRANLRYWPTVAPTVRRALRHWEHRARAHTRPRPASAGVAQAPRGGLQRGGRRDARDAGTPSAAHAPDKSDRLPLEVLYDDIDGLSEAASDDAIQNGRQLYLAFTDALTPTVQQGANYYRFHPRGDDDGYLQELADTVRRALSELPSLAEITTSMQRAAARCAEVQIRAHAVTSIGIAQLEEWAKRESEHGELGWREFLAGAASSVLAVHALMALAAHDQATEAQADAIDGLYHSIGVLSTMLDSVIDYQQDAHSNVWSYSNLDDDPEMLGEALVAVVRHASERAPAVTDAAHHLMTLAGVVAYYGSAPAAGEGPARSVFARLQEDLHPSGRPHYDRHAQLATGSTVGCSAIRGRWRTDRMNVSALTPWRLAGWACVSRRAHRRRQPSLGASSQPARLRGTRGGADTLRARIADAVELGIRELTVYSFSTENWSRPTEEVRELIDMIARRIAEDGPRLHARGVRMRFVGRRERIPADLLERMRHAESLTENNRAITLFIALDYGARAEILDAAARYRGGGESAFRRLLYVPEMHDPDLIIRTGGESRLSNYLLWQGAYAELVFREERWPDFTRTMFVECLAEYAARDRRWGGR